MKNGVVKAYLYEKSWGAKFADGSRSLNIPMTPALRAWRVELSQEAGIAPDNKIAFELERGVCVSFWDGVVSIGDHIQQKR